MKFVIHVSVDCRCIVSCEIWLGLVKGMDTRAPAKCENLVKIVIFPHFFAFALATQYTNQNEIKPVRIDHWPIVTCQIWPDRECAHAASFSVARRCLRFLLW